MCNSHGDGTNGPHECLPMLKPAVENRTWGHIRKATTPVHTDQPGRQQSERDWIIWRMRGTIPKNRRSRAAHGDGPCKEGTHNCKQVWRDQGSGTCRPTRLEASTHPQLPDCWQQLVAAPVSTGHEEKDIREVPGHSLLSPPRPALSHMGRCVRTVAEPARGSEERRHQERQNMAGIPEYEGLAGSPRVMSTMRL